MMKKKISKKSLICQLEVNVSSDSIAVTLIRRIGVYILFFVRKGDQYSCLFVCAREFARSSISFYHAIYSSKVDSFCRYRVISLSTYQTHRVWYWFPTYCEWIGTIFLIYRSLDIWSVSGHSVTRDRAERVVPSLYICKEISIEKAEIIDNWNMIVKIILQYSVTRENFCTSIEIVIHDIWIGQIASFKKIKIITYMDTITGISINFINRNEENRI